MVIFLLNTHLFSLKEIKYICKIIGKGKPQFGKLKLRKNENINLYPSIKKIKKKLKWKPKIQFSTGVKITINSFK